MAAFPQVFDVDDENSRNEPNGFVFEGADEGSLDAALDRALQCAPPASRPLDPVSCASPTRPLVFSRNQGFGQHLLRLHKNCTFLYSICARW